MKLDFLFILFSCAFARGLVSHIITIIASVYQARSDPREELDILHFIAYDFRLVSFSFVS